MTRTQELRGRPVTASEAREALRRLINSHFHKPDHARCSIPANCMDDDLLLSDYLIEMEERYFIGADNSGHEYYVPVSKRAEFQKWAELPEDDEAGWEAPEYAHRIEGEFTFTDPRCE